MKPLQLFLCCIICLCTACRHEYKKALCNGYALYAYAADEDMCVIYCDKYGCLDIIGPTVFSVGYDKNYVIAKQHPAIYPEKENKRITNYYIISLKQSISWKNPNVAMGPLNEKQFAEWKQKLKIADTLSFSTTFNNVK
jgi:hypothetical protein